MPNLIRIVLAAISLTTLPFSVRGAEEYLNLGDRRVVFEFSGQRNGLVFVSLHSNEVSGVSGARAAMASSGGQLVLIKAGGDRRLHLAPGKRKISIDPNRMFSPDGIKRDLNRFGVPRPEDPKTVYDFGKAYYERYLHGAKLIIALHNNTNGSYSINSYSPGGSESGATGKLFINPKEDPDDFFLVTREADYKALAKMGYNVVLQSSSPPDDGSLSVLCTRMNLRYINVEAEHGKSAKQAAMLKVAASLYR